MTTEDAFLQAIIDAPDDDTPRLIYADWLEDHGHPERSVFIRVQCELAKEPDERRRPAGLLAKEQALLKEHEGAWVTPLLRPFTGMVSHWTFRRGFIEAVIVEARGLVLHADSLFRLTPIRDLGIYLARSRMGAVASLPYLARLSALRVNINALGDEGVAILASSPYLGGLTSLELSRNDIGDAGVQALSACPCLSRVTRLDLSHNSIGDAGACTLARSLPHLQKLTLYWNRINEPGRTILREQFGNRVKIEEADEQERLRLSQRR